MASSTPHYHQDGESISYLTQTEAAAIDETLMGDLGFSIDQLMVSFYRFQQLSKPKLEENHLLDP